MSRANKNKKIIGLVKEENEDGCSSSSSSPTSPDGDCARNVTGGSFRMTTTKNGQHDALQSSGSEAVAVDTTAESLEDSGRSPPDLSTILSSVNNFDNVRIARILPVDGKKSKHLLIVDNPATKTNDRSQEMNYCSRRVFRLSEEAAKKFSLRKGMQVFERHSFKKPSEVVELMVNEDIKPKSATNKFFHRNIAFKRNTAAVAATEKCKKQKHDPDEFPLCDDLWQTPPAPPPPNAIAEKRTRLLQHFLREHCIAPNARRLHHYRGPLSLRVPAVGITDGSNNTVWLPSENAVSISRNSKVAGVNLLLNDDSVTGVSNYNTDASAADGNNDVADSSNSEDGDSKTKKKNRCVLCRKKVGLTGFECRCGGLYCGIHRYSDKHNCTFDYRQLGAQEIRRNNPVVVGEKIQKI